jgi:hypothetical protein
MRISQANSQRPLRIQVSRAITDPFDSDAHALGHATSWLHFADYFPLTKYCNIDLNLYL